jgi:hypothetical protein
VSEEAVQETPIEQTADSEVSETTKEKTEGKTDAVPAKRPARRRRSSAKKPAVEGTSAVANAVVQNPEEAIDDAAKNENKPEPSEFDRNDSAEGTKTTVINVGDEATEVAEKPKKGWWRRG